MTLLFTMLPIYLFGNLHCIGMCGPLVMMIGKHRFRYFYFFGRALSFALTGALAGQAGAILEVILKKYQIPAVASLFFGGIIVAIGLCTLLRIQLPSSPFMARVSQSLSLLMLKDQAWPTFLFGFFTVFLPCGQTLIVFTACALSGDMFVGLINGFAFALLTSPSLYLAMQAHHLLRFGREHYHTVMGICALAVGTVAVCRGFAELGVIPHWILNPHSPQEFHIVVF
ncbi:MAG: sulfite exporter TauE/SafE family protein [Chlamydiia bacterium]|nr:sulfite exporter TauE/SafE family protein [Chlamydiia bacterium]